MRVLIIGAAGMIGRKVTARLTQGGPLGAIDHLTLADVVAPAAPEGFSAPVETVTADLSRPGAATDLLQHRPDIIFHLAAIVSGEAEADFEKGYRVNLDGTRELFEAIRLQSIEAGAGLPAAGRVHLVGRRVRCPVPGCDRRRLPHHAAHQLRHPEGDGRVAAQRLLAPRLHGRGRRPAADHLHPARPAEQGGVRLLFRYLARAAGRQGGGAAGSRHGAALVRQPPRRRRHGAARGHPRQRAARLAPHACPCRACRPPSATRSRRCAGSRARARPS